MTGNGSRSEHHDLEVLRGMAVAVLPSREEIEVGLVALSEAIEAERATLRASTRVPFLRRPILTAATAFATAVAIFFAVLAMSPPPAAAVLEGIARVAEQRDALDVPAGKFVFVTSSQTALIQAETPEGERVTFLLPEEREIWIATDGSRVIRRTVANPEFFDDTDAERFREANLADEFGVGRSTVDRFGPTFDDLDPSIFPTDPVALLTALDELIADDSRPRSAALLELAGDLLIETDASPELRAGLLRALTRVDGLSVVEGLPEGLTGVAAEYAVGDQNVELRLVFDSVTSNLILREEIAVDGFPSDGIPPGAVLVESTHGPPVVVDDFGP